MYLEQNACHCIEDHAIVERFTWKGVDLMHDAARCSRQDML